MDALSASIEHFTFEVTGVSDRFAVLGFEGSEELSKSYKYQLELVTENPDIVLADAIGCAGLLRCFGRSGEEERFTHGILENFQVIEKRGDQTIYSTDFIPGHNLLAYRVNHRIFQNITVPDIIQKIFDDAGISADQINFATQGTYAPREYCVQYGESDLDFIERIMAEEGIYYYYEHSPSNHVITIADNISAHQEIKAPAVVKFHQPTTLISHDDQINRFSSIERIASGKVVLRDYNFEKPKLQLQAESHGESNSELEVYSFPGDYADTGAGKNLAKIRLEELQAFNKCSTGNTDSKRLVPGYRFTMSLHPRSDFNREYLIVSVNQEASQPQVLRQHAPSDQGTKYVAKFVCIPSDVPYRAPGLARKKIVGGVQTAIVVGPDGEEIYTDEEGHGRVKVQFHWDREGQYNEESSCWIRVSQSWAGAGWGGMAIPRIGQEVVVDFIEGDPDRPIITGRVYHGTNRPPYTLPDEKTKSTFKSNSSKGGDGFNEIRFEDKKGEEQVFIHAEKDQDVRVKNDTKNWIGNDNHLIVKNDQFELVDNDKHQTVKGDHIQKIDGTMSITVGADVQQKTAQNFAHDAGGEIHLVAGKKVVIEAGSELTVVVGGSFININSSGIAIVGGKIELNPGGGSAGSGKGASPDAPKLPLEADNDEPGDVGDSDYEYDDDAQTAALIFGEHRAAPFCKACAANK